MTRTGTSLRFKWTQRVKGSLLGGLRGCCVVCSRHSPGLGEGGPPGLIHSLLNTPIVTSNQTDKRALKSYKNSRTAQPGARAAGNQEKQKRKTIIALFWKVQTWARAHSYDSRAMKGMENSARSRPFAKALPATLLAPADPRWLQDACGNHRASPASESPDATGDRWRLDFVHGLSSLSDAGEMQWDGGFRHPPGLRRGPGSPWGALSVT